ncbi:MAG: DUF1552 domain-containing protein [Gemmatimonadota bacterium]|jgi:hypothetical protein|nr:DUF1552 domain-containing protein [Gemmatimonadota bacterium]
MNIITGKHLDRRTFLRGVGASVALPMLDAMVPAGRAWADETVDPGSTRLICVEEVMGTAGSSPLGQELNLFEPLTTGKNFQLSGESQLKPLEGFRDYLTVITNTDCQMAEAWAPQEIGGGHDRTTAVFLTQAHPKQTQGLDIYVGRSLDQLHAQRYGQGLPLPSLQLDVESDSGGGSNGYHSYYSHRMSWASPNEPLPAINNPRVAFDLMFGAGFNPEDRAARRVTRRSLLDRIASEISRMRTSLGASDRMAMDSFLTNVRELERRIELVEARNSTGEERAMPEAPISVPDSWIEHTRLMFDLQVLALESDLTRVITFKTGRDLSNRIFPESGVLKAFHATSHHSNVPDVIYEYHQINTHRLSAMAYLLEKLRDSNEAGTSLLDKTAIIWGSGMGDPNIHSNMHCPLILMGKANGALEGNLHIKAPEGTPMANAFVSLLNAMGHEDLHSFGDSSGRLPLTSPAHSSGLAASISSTGVG